MITDNITSNIKNSNDEKYRLLFESNRDSITLFRIDSNGVPGNFIETNSAATDLFGYTKDELINMSFLDFEVNSDEKSIKSFDQNGIQNFETIVQNKNGDLINVEIQNVLINYLDEPAVMSTSRNITERIQTEKNLRKAQKNSATILDAIPDLLFEVNLEGRIFHYQAQHEDLLAVPPSYFMGKKIDEVLPPAVAKTCMEAIFEAHEKGFSTGKEYVLELTEGKCWFELTVSPVKENNNLDKHFIVFARDISARKNAEESLQISKGKLRGVFELANSGIILTNINGKYLLFNNWCNESLGYTRDELNKLSREEITHPDDLEKSNFYFSKIIAGTIDQYQIEKRYIRKDKSHFWADVSVSAIKNKNNQIVNTIAIITDITDRKSAEEKLKLSESRLIAAQAVGKIGSWETDFTYKKIICSKELSKIFGFDPDTTILSIANFMYFIHPEDRHLLKSTFINSLKNKTVNSVEHRIITPEGIEKVVEERWEILYDDRGHHSHIIGTCQDISERKQSEAKLKLTSEKFQDLVNSTEGIVWEADANTLIFNYVSKEAERLLGYPVEDWYTKDFWVNHLHPEDKEDTINFCSSQTILLQKHDFTYRFRAKDGSYVWLRDLVTVVVENDKPKLLRGVMFDITKEIKTNQSLIESEEKYRGLVENSPDAIVTYVEDKIVFINDEGLRMLGAKNRQEVIGKAVLQFIHPDSLESVIQRMKEVVLDNNASDTVEERFMKLNGEPFDVEIKAIPIVYNDKIGVQVIVHDITKRKQINLELNKINRVYALISQINDLILRTRNREELFQEICNIAVNFGKFRMSWIGSLTKDNQTIKTSAFAGFEDGYFTKGPNNINIHNNPSDRGPIETAMLEWKTVICNDIANDKVMYKYSKDAIQRDYKSSITIPIIVRNKTIGCFNLYSDETNFFSSEEEISLLEKIVLNISFALETILIEEERKGNEEKIRQLSKAVEQSPISIIITNLSGEIEYANPKFIETTGYSIGEIIGQNTRILKSGHTSSDGYIDLWNTINQGKEWHGEFHNKKKDGTLYWESASISPIINEDGQSTHFIALKEDITQRKIAEQDLITAKLRAEESDRLKLAFLANMSHEIRTPMNGILGFTELLKAPKLSGKEQSEYISIIEKSGKRMLNIINDIISISKIESGQIEVNLTETNINNQIGFLKNFFKPETKQKGIQLVATKQLSEEESVILTDTEKVYAILTNLVKNAIKFTHEGKIEFGCERKGRFIEFFVKDTGLGISTTQQKLIFERFRQANESLTRSHEGSGLGLAISKAYVEMLGGKIWVESVVGKGSSFYFTIPIDTEFVSKEKNSKTTTDLLIKEENKISDLKVLIVEDDAISKLLISIALKPYSKEIIKVSSGSQAIEACRNNPDFDLIMMDINMPEMDGYEATMKIREFNDEIIIIAQTANGLQSDRDKAIITGCNDYISKPININALSKLIHKYFKK